MTFDNPSPEPTADESGRTFPGAVSLFRRRVPATLDSSSDWTPGVFFGFLLAALAAAVLVAL